MAIKKDILSENLCPFNLSKFPHLSSLEPPNTPVVMNRAMKSSLMKNHMQKMKTPITVTVTKGK